MADPVPPTLDELITANWAAILTTLQTGHSVTFNGRTYTANDLDDLWTNLRNLQALQSGGAVGGAAWSRVAAYDKGV